MTAPPPPPEDDPTLGDPVEPRGARVADDEEVVAAPVVRPYPWWLWGLIVLFLGLAVLFLVLWLMERERHEGRALARRAECRAGARQGLCRRLHARDAVARVGAAGRQGDRPGAAGRCRAREERAGDGRRLRGPGAGDRAQARRQHRDRRRAAAESQGLQATKKAVDSTKPNGIVVSQDPAEGTKVSKGTTVGLAVSNGHGQVKVPDVQGKSSADAAQALANAGLVPIVIQVRRSSRGRPSIAQVRGEPAGPAGSKVRSTSRAGPLDEDATVTTSQTTTA